MIDCERDARRRWAPEAQALIELMTERFTRGPRLSCGCQKRYVTATSDGGLTIFRETKVPSAPLCTTMAAFLADNVHDEKVCEQVRALRPGQTIELPGLGVSFCLTELNPVQAWILRELPKAQGIFGLVSVGGGKTVAGILAPLAIPHVKSVILFGKPDQRLHYRNAYLRLREHFKVPSMVFDDNKLEGSYIVTGTPVLRFIPYTKLSNPKSTELLEQYNPDAIIADESHLLASKNSSRTMRFLRYMTAHPNVIFANWSGSTIKKSLKDASHLAAHALGLGSPYPIMPNEVEAWSAVMDPVSMPDTKSDTAKVLYKVFGGQDLDGMDDSPRFLVSLDDQLPVRQGFRDRMIHTLGVISTVSSSVTSSITISQRVPPKIPDDVRKALAGVRQDELRPDGEVLVERIDVVMCAREVAAGWYGYWAFHRGEPPELIDRWYSARKAYSKALRTKLRGGEPHLDSPMLCANAAERFWQSPRYEGPLPVWPEETWPEWKAVKDLVDPDPRVKWIDDYLARDAAAWSQEHCGIVWCQSRAFGKKVAQLAGINYHGGGPDAEAKILAEDGKKSIVASIDAHGTGRDGLQYKFCKQLIAEPPSSGDRWEQLLGRVCRAGQEADTIETWIYAHVEEFKDAMRKAIMYAEFIEATTPNRQLLLAADIDIDFSL